MSLLMKALEKAAKDRGEARTETEAVPPKAELALEPIAPPSPPPPKAEPAARPAAAPPPPRSAVEARPASPPPRPSAPVTPAPAPAREQAQAQASTVLQAQAASRPPAGDVGAYVRAHPVLLIGTLAGVFAAGFGGYVYLQIFHPGFFVGQPTIAAKGLPPPPAVLKPPPPAPGTAAPGEPLATENVLKEAAAESAAATKAPGAKPQPATRPAPEETPARSTTIVVSRGTAEPVMNPVLGQAYAALQGGQTDAAQRLYAQLAKAEPKNVDALLGLAATAIQQGNSDEAARLYLQILELDPRHALAQSGLIALLGRADPLAAESKLKQLIAREPSAWLYFTLGNLYADQSLWAPAQQAYFQAHHLEPANPDYAYNLAVGFEHVSQPKLALEFYRRAVQLTAAKGRSNFNASLVQERIEKLARQVE